MSTSAVRLLAALAIAGIVHQLTTHFVNGGNGAWLVGGSMLLGILLFLALIDLGVIAIQARTFGHMLHLRCLRHPELIAYCGFEADYARMLKNFRQDPEVIFGVANCHPSGRIYAAQPKARHGHIFALMHEYGDDDQHGKVLQGFVTSHGRWVNRQEAMLIAQAAGQVQRTTGPADTLFSEDLFAGPLLTQRQLEDQAHQLVLSAIYSQKVVRISTRPLPDRPLAMGRHEMVVDVRDCWELTRWKAEQEERTKQVSA